MWQLKAFEDLTVKELHAIYFLRTEVFIVEQECAYQDVDEWDLVSLHLFNEVDGELISYARIIPGESLMKIGRIIVSPRHRKQNKGRELLKTAISYCDDHYGELPVLISAQAHLEKFYGAFGFKVISEEYLEDGIPHVDMIRNLKEKEGVSIG